MFKKLGSVLLGVTLLLGIAACTDGVETAAAGVYVSVDINPSIEFIVDEEDKKESRPVQEEPEFYPLVLPEDKDLITDYLYLAMEQMQPCKKK